MDEKSAIPDAEFDEAAERKFHSELDATAPTEAPTPEYDFPTSRWSLFLRSGRDIDSIITGAEETLVSSSIPVTLGLLSALIASVRTWYEKYFSLAQGYSTQLGSVAPEEWAEQTFREDLAEHLRMRELAIPPHERPKRKDEPCSGQSKIAEFIKHVCGASVDVSLNFIADEEKRFRKGIDETLFHCRCDAAPIARRPAHQLSNRVVADGQAARPLPFTKDSDNPRVDGSNAFYQDGNTWIVTFGGQTHHFRGLVGFRYISVLLRHAGHELICKQILTVCNSGAAQNVQERELGDSDLSIGEVRQEYSDEQAVREYKARAREIIIEITRARQKYEDVEVQRLQGELEAITEHIQQQRGKSGKTRAFATDADRARTTVTKGITRACEEMAKSNKKLAAYFRDTITTGTACIFRDLAISWQLEKPSA